MKKILHELNYLKLEDLFQIVIFIISIPLSIIFFCYKKILKKEIWLISEDKNEARDNGFCFFEYMNKRHKDVITYYAINYKCKDYLKVKKVGKTVKFGSIFHWVLYFNANHVISSQKNGRPNAAICYVLEVYKIIKSKFVFLQHGITVSDAKWLYYNNTKFKMFICGAKPEYDYVSKKFGYPKDKIAYTGFNRFDNYFNINVDNNMILLIPSWREWIASKNEYSKKYEDTSNFENTEYFQKYNELINNKDLCKFLEKNNLKLYFYPHRNMQKYISFFNTNCKNIEIVSNKNIEIRDLLKKSAVMITDYSSVFFDFAYMKKPIIFYQFDEVRFREAQYQKGYFDYRDGQFGKVFINSNDVIDELKRLYKNGWKIDKSIENNHKLYFPLYDNKNNERIYNLIKDL